MVNKLNKLSISETGNTIINDGDFFFPWQRTVVVRLFVLYNPKSEKADTVC